MGTGEVPLGGPMDIGVCLGDLYSVSWIELAESQNLHEWSLQQQFEAIRLRTSANHTYQYVRPAPAAALACRVQCRGHLKCARCNRH